MSLENRLRRLEAEFEYASGPEDAAPVSDEHRVVRERLRAVEAEFMALAPEGQGHRRRPLSADEDLLIDLYLDLRDLEDRLLASGELGGVT